MTDKECESIARAKVPGCDGKTAPPVFLGTRVSQIGSTEDRVTSDVIGITCCRAHFATMTELLSRIPRDVCP